MAPRASRCRPAAPKEHLFGVVPRIPTGIRSPTVKLFNLFSSPRGFPEELKARLDAWIMSKAPDRYFFSKSFPSIDVDKFCDHHF